MRWTPIVLMLLMAGAARAEDERPNIVFLFSDDHACQAIGAYGSRINETPQIDRLAREGAVFAQSFCTNSICGPSRATVLTGQGSYYNPDYRTAAGPVKREGYSTRVTTDQRSPSPRPCSMRGQGARRRSGRTPCPSPGT